MKKYLSNDFNLAAYAEVADECPLWSASFGLKLLDYIDYRKNITALDIGFGTGFPLTEIALRLGESSVVYGIDPWKDAAGRAKRKIDYFRINNIRILEGYAENIPLENLSVDLITSNNGLNNVNDIDRVLSECSRLLKSGGQFIQTCNLDKTMYEFYEAFSEVLHKSGLDDLISKLHRHIYDKRKPLDETISMINMNGFVIKNLEHSQFNYRFADATAMLNHYFIRLAFMESWIKLVPPERLDEVFGKVESVLNETAAKTGGFNLSIPFVMINSYKK